jgi:hemolysin III
MSVPAPAKPRLRGVSHQYGFFVWIAAGVALVVTAPTGRATFGAVVYVLSIGLMLGTSALYHRRQWTPAGETRMNRLDHSMIFVAIAGTYTPIALLAVTGPIEAILLATVWTGAAAGIVIEWAPLQLPRGYVTAVYLTLGWVAVIALPQLWVDLGGLGFLLLAGGGVLYTVGAVVHATRRPDPVPTVFGFHELFHVFVLAAIAMHYALIAFVVLPRG